MIEEELVRQIADLQYRLDGLVKPEQGLQFTLADKDADGDMDPLTSVSWDGDSKSGTGTINWNTVFGVPANARAVHILVTIQDADVEIGFSIKAKSTTTADSFIIRTQVADVYVANSGTVPIAADGTSYWSVSAGTIDNVFIRVIGWYL